jgi:hypothetical protein
LIFGGVWTKIVATEKRVTYLFVGFHAMQQLLLLKSSSIHQNMMDFVFIDGTT